jgi:hypothetical protein
MSSGKCSCVEAGAERCSCQKMSGTWLAKQDTARARDFGRVKWTEGRQETTRSSCPCSAVPHSTLNQHPTNLHFPSTQEGQLASPTGIRTLFPSALLSFPSSPHVHPPSTKLHPWHSQLPVTAVLYKPSFFHAQFRVLIIWQAGQVAQSSSSMVLSPSCLRCRSCRSCSLACFGNSFSLQPITEAGPFSAL